MTEEENTSGSDLPDSVNIGLNHLITGVFVLGLSVGFTTGFVASGLDLPEAPSPSKPSQPSQNPVEVMVDIADSTNVDSSGMRDYIQSTGMEEINEDKSAIENATGQIGTPTFFIGNSEIGYVEVSGAQPFTRLRPLVERKLEEAASGNSTVPEDEHSLENISFEGEPKMGEESAPLNIIEYSDYGCPWCAEWHGVDAIPNRPIDRENSFQNVRDSYVETGDVQFVAKDYPVQRLHPEAVTAHKAANYVWENSPENFWEFSQKLYEERDRW